MDEIRRVDMGRHQRPYEPGPQARARIEAEFAAAYPDPETRPKVPDGPKRYSEMEALTYRARTMTPDPDPDKETTG
jgi:hypothetical protein